MEKKLRVGIIGCGGIANGKHMPSLKKIPEVEMVAFCDIIVERAEKAAKDYGMEGDLVAGANIAGFLKVAEAMKAQGCV